jgi:hypothetical protein
VPYHLGYFDRYVVAYLIECGPNLSTAEQWVARSNREVKAWNERMFARRAPDQSVVQSLAQMQASREAIPHVIGRMQDTDFDQPAWFPLLVGGWVPSHAVLERCRLHTWSQFMELRLRHPASPERALPERCRVVSTWAPSPRCSPIKAPTELKGGCIRCRSSFASRVDLFHPKGSNAYKEESHVKRSKQGPRPPIQ